MANIFRDQPRVRLFIGAVICAFVWITYIVRVTLGTGPMHDEQGNQAPAVHYLAGAALVTGVVAFWIFVRSLMTRR
jgi:membrane protease YdiL (CAAX protease family)